MSSEGAWNEISMFESTDLVKHFYSRKTGRELNSSRATEIASHFSQGREYFRTSNLSTNSVRPLLQYYGVLALSRGLLLYSNPTTSESGLVPQHGLSCINWHDVLGVDNNDITQLVVRIDKKGTFPQLRDTAGKNYTYTPIAAYDMPNTKVECSISNPADGTRTFGDILSRIPSVMKIYGEILGRKSNCFVSTMHMLPNSMGYEVGMFGSKEELHDEEDCKIVLGIEGSIATRVDRNILLTSYNFPARVFTNNNHINDQSTPIPHLEDGVGEYLAAIRPFSDGKRLSYLSRLFILSYMLGMIVRYHPTHWISITRRQLNNNMYPIFETAFDTIEKDFPKAILERLK
jgi:YaaC-like Protein